MSTAPTGENGRGEEFDAGAGEAPPADALEVRPPASGASALARAAVRVRSDLPLLALDALLTVGAYFASLVLRFDGAVPPSHWRHLRSFLAVALVVHLLANWAFGLYRQMWRHASVAEARNVMLASAVATTSLFAVVATGWQSMRPSVVLLGGAAAMMLVGALRFHSRLFAFRRNEGLGFGLRVAVVGAGETGAALVREMRRNRGAGLNPVVVVDDDRRAQGRSLAGVPVVGVIDDMAGMLRDARVNHVVLAIPSASPELTRRVAAQAEAAGVAVKILPGVRELLGGQASVRDVRDLRIEDLLGREQVETDLDQVRNLLAGRRVLVTGAGGSIGSEIARQVARCRPAALLLLDHDETHLHDAAAGLAVEPLQLLADIRDRDAVDEAMRRHRPEVVFHAAAHKHVPLLELHPIEALRTNVVGTYNVVTAAAAAGVERLVFISTDKAVEPSSVMGASKRLGEQIVAAQARPGLRYCSVRFGNVLGSRGSVIPTFARQIAAGGPVTVTDPRMTRFFMSVQEAVQLVLQAAAFAAGGEVFMLEMGEAVNIHALAARMIRLSGRAVGTDVPIRITGARPGEKLFEVLRAPDEEVVPTSHPKIVAIRPERLSDAAVHGTVAALADVAARRDQHDARRLLFAFASRPGRVLQLTALERGDAWSSSTI